MGGQTGVRSSFRECRLSGTGQPRIGDRIRERRATCSNATQKLDTYGSRVGRLVWHLALFSAASVDRHQDREKKKKRWPVADQ